MNGWPLTGLRVLELPGLATAFAGKCLADLGADVVRLIPASGDPLEAVAPHSPLPNGTVRSAAAIAYGHGEVVAYDGGEAPRILERAGRAEVILHPYTAAELEGRGLARLPALAEEGRVVVAITPFGSEGPLSAWQSSDLVHYAMGGYAHMTGEREGRPIQPSAPLQVSLHAGLHAFVATLAALRRRRETGIGAAIDQAERDTVAWMLTNTYQHWDMDRVNLRRSGDRRDMGQRRRLRTLFTAKDGWLVWMFTTGHVGSPALRRLLAWMRSLGTDTSELEAIGWEQMDLLDHDESLIYRIEGLFNTFFATRPKAELLAWAAENGLMLAPVASLADVLVDEQLAARDAWRDGPAVAPGLRLPGAPIKVEGVAWTPPPVGVVASTQAAAGPPTPSTAAAPRAPLAGVRVLDLGTTVAAPTVGRHLADLGAEVIKIESETHPDTLRIGTPYAGGQRGLNRSGYFGAYNAGKKSVTLNLRERAGREALRRLVERSDVLLENYAPGVTERLGIAPATLRGWNPRLVVASHSLSGQTGPRRSQRGYGQVAGALTGWYDLTGEEGGPPIGPYSAYTDFLSWPYLLAAIIVALEVRDTTGAAPAIDHAQVESSLQFAAPLLVDYQLSGRLATRRGNHRDDAVPSNTFPCAGDDRWIALTVESEAQWAAACAVLDLPAAVGALATVEARRAAEAEIDAAIAERTAGHDVDVLAALLQARGVPAGPVARAQDLFSDRQLAARRFFVRRPHAELGEHAILTPSFRISGATLEPATAAPLLGEHTLDVLTSIAGYTEDEIADLAASGALT